MREIDRTLARLETDHIDIYILHVYDDDTPLEETLRAMDDVVRAGKTRYMGVSNFQTWQVLKALWTQDRLGLDPLLCRHARTPTTSSTATWSARCGRRSATRASGS